MNRKSILLAVFAIALSIAVRYARAVSGPLGFGVLFDSANTASTAVYRDGSGNFSAGTVTASLTGAVTTTAAFVSVSSATTANSPFSLDGQYTTAQIQAKTPTVAGQLVYNTTLANVCVSTGATVQGYKLVGTATTTCQ